MLCYLRENVKTNTAQAKGPIWWWISRRNNNPEDGCCQKDEDNLLLVRRSPKPRTFQKKKKKREELSTTFPSFFNHNPSSKHHYPLLSFSFERRPFIEWPPVGQPLALQNPPYRLSARLPLLLPNLLMDHSIIHLRFPVLPWIAALLFRVCCLVPAMVPCPQRLAARHGLAAVGGSAPRPLLRPLPRARLR